MFLWKKRNLKRREDKMTKWDDKYIELCKEILDKGIEVENRTGINSIKIPSWHFKFDLGEEYPILSKA